MASDFQLSKDIGLSPAPTLERVKKLENTGIIQSYHAKLNPAKIGLGVSTFVTVTLDGHRKSNLTKFTEAVAKIDEVVECHHITGDGDFMVRVVARDITHYQQFILEKLSEIEDVVNMKTMVILATYKDSEGLPLQD